MGSLQRVIQRIRVWLSSSQTIGPLDAASVVRLGKSLASTENDEFDCDDVYRLMDRYAESILAGQDGAGWMRKIHAHLKRCPDCRAEFEALIHILRSEPV